MIRKLHHVNLQHFREVFLEKLLVPQKLRHQKIEDAPQLQDIILRKTAIILKKTQ